MRRGILAIAVPLVLAIGAGVPALDEIEAATSGPAPSFTVYAASGSEEAGSIPVKVCKHGTLNASSSTVTLYTVDGTATSSGDYVAKRITLSFGAAASCQLVPIVLRNDLVPEGTETLTVKLAKGSNSRLYRGTATVTITDVDVHVHPDPEEPPPPPPPPPLPEDPLAWSPAELREGGYARARSNCSSIYRSAETDRVGITFLGVKGGTVYKVIPGGWGWSPVKNIEGHTGKTWTLLEIGEPYLAYGRFITVADACLEGVTPKV